MLLLLSITRPHIFKQIRTCSCEPRAVTLISKKEVRRFIVDCMVSVGTSTQNACMLASALLAADEKGYKSHGVNRLPFYVDDVRKCIVDGKATPEIENESVATAWVNGKDTLGPVVGHFCMDLAIKKASETGVGLVSANNSAHYGIASYYSIAAMEKGFIGFTCTNTSPLMVPFGAKQVALGTNPLSLAAPAVDGDSFVFDMATTTVAKGKIEEALRAGAKIPEGWVQDADGKPITDPKKALTSGGLLPLGGSKGTGLALLVEVFTGILGGGNYGIKIPKWGKTKKKANLCHSFMAINPHCFAPCFEERLSDLLDSIRKLDSVNPDNKMMVPGDPERVNTQIVAEDGGIEYKLENTERLEDLADELGVEPMKPKC